MTAILFFTFHDFRSRVCCGCGSDDVYKIWLRSDLQFKSYWQLFPHRKSVTGSPKLEFWGENLNFSHYNPPKKPYSIQKHVIWHIPRENSFGVLGCTLLEEPQKVNKKPWTFDVLKNRYLTSDLYVRMYVKTHICCI